MRGPLVALAIIGLGIVSEGVSLARATPAQRCAAAKRKFAAKKILSFTRCDALAVMRGVPVDTSCTSRVRTKFASRWAALEARGGCATTGDEAAIEQKVDAHDADLQQRLGVTGGASPCTSGKFRDAGKKGSCRLRCAAKASLKGLSLSSTVIVTCLAKCSAKFSSAFNRDEGRGGCHSVGDAATIESVVDAFVDDVVDELPDGTPPVSTTSTTLPGGSTTTSLPGGSTSTSVPQSTSTTVPGATTTTTLPVGCCGDATRLSFTTAIGSGTCGTAHSFDGSTFRNLQCSGLYFGGGSNGVPLPAQIPDMGTSITKVSACAGTTLTLVGAASGEEGATGLTCTKQGCLFGPPLPIPNASTPPISTCLINSLSSDAVGSADCVTGTVNLSMPLNSEIFLTGDVLPSEPGIQPCPLCKAGVCAGGPNNGLGCTAGDSPIAGHPEFPTSHDCPPDPGQDIGGLPIGFVLSTGTISATGVPSGTQTRVFCGYCRDADGTGSFQNPGAKCLDTTPGGPGTATCAGSFESCEQNNQGAFGPAGGIVKTITEHGVPAGNLTDGLLHDATLVSIFCIPPSFNATVDQAANLPGPGAVSLTGKALLPVVISSTSSTLVASTTSTSVSSTTSTSTSVTTTTSTSTTTTLPAFCSPVLPVPPSGSIRFTVGLGTTNCGGVGLTPGPVAPFTGELDDGVGVKIRDLGLGCLDLGAGQNNTLPPAGLPDGSTTELGVSGINGTMLTLAGSDGTGPEDCSRGAGPGRHCVNGAPGTNGQGACTSDDDCGGVLSACSLDANCYFGPPIPVSAGVLSTCAVNAFQADACGSADLASGSSNLFVALAPRLYLTGNAASPCPQCVGGTCTAGERAGLGCSGGVGSKGTSLECPPLASQFVATVPLTLSPLTTGTSTTTAPSGLFCPGQTHPGAFGQALARTIRQTGSPLLGGPMLFSETVAGNFCIPGTGIQLIDNALDVPGPGSVSVQGTASVCLLGPLCF